VAASLPSMEKISSGALLPFLLRKWTSHFRGGFKLILSTYLFIYTAPLKYVILMDYITICCIRGENHVWKVMLKKLRIIDMNFASGNMAWGGIFMNVNFLENLKTFAKRCLWTCLSYGFVPSYRFVKYKV
jgi:hypothetical protein